MAANLKAIAPAATYPNRLTFTRASELVRVVKPVRYAIKHVLERDAVGTLIAAPGTAKTFLAVDWACCIATGTPWQGHKVEQGAVLYVAGEGHNGISKRLAGWQKAHKVSLQNAHLYVSDRAVPLNANEGYNALRAAIAEVAETPALIIVDTLARNFVGDENSSKDMGAFIAAVDDLRRPMQATVLIVHHSGWGAAERGRGSSALFGGVDREWLAKRDGDVIVLTCLKAKDAELPPPIGLRLESVPLDVFDEDGDEETTAVLRAATLRESKPKGLGANQIKAMTALRKLYADNLSTQSSDPDKVLVSMDGWRVAAGLNRQRFAEVCKALEERGQVVIERPHVRIAHGADD